MLDEKTWLVVFFALMVLAVGGVYVAAEHGQNVAGQSTSTINVGGDASMSVSPNEAVVYLSIETLNDNASESQKANAKIFNKVKDALISKGINESKIKTTDYRLYLAKEWHTINGTYKERVLGYKTIHRVKVSTNDTENVGALLDDVVSAGATVDSVSFDLTDESRKKIKEELLNKAVTDAKQKAEIIASAAGAKVGKLRSANYSNPGYYPIYRNYGYETLKSDAESSSTDTTVSPGEIKVSVSVSTSFEVK